MIFGLTSQDQLCPTTDLVEENKSATTSHFLLISFGFFRGWFSQVTFVVLNSCIIDHTLVR